MRVSKLALCDALSAFEVLPIMSVTDLAFWIGFLQILGIDLILSGDNAVVIALACRGLPQNHRRRALVLGSGVAVGLRIAFAFVIFELLRVPYLKLAGGLLLLWIATHLGKSSPEEKERGEGDERRAGAGSGASTWRAVRMIALADAVMSLDNVVAIVGAARGDLALLILGLAISIPLVIWGSTLTLKLIDRFPVVVTLGAGLVGWIGGDMIAAEPALHTWFGAHEWTSWAAPILGIAIAIAGSRILGKLPAAEKRPPAC